MTSGLALLAALVALQLLAAIPLARAQLPGPTVKYAPCTDGTEHTCAGEPGSSAPAICCNALNFRCATRADTGAPRCAFCPQTCPDCAPGYMCGRDANGCATCVADDGSGGGSFVRSPPPPPPPPGENRSGDQCGPARPCGAEQICATGYCRKDPCLAKICPLATPRCEVDASYQAQCRPALSPPPPSPRPPRPSPRPPSPRPPRPSPRPPSPRPPSPRPPRPSPRPPRPRPPPPRPRPRPPPSPLPGSSCRPACGAGFTCQRKPGSVPAAWQCVKQQPSVRRASRVGRRLAGSSRRELRLGG